MSKIDKYFDKLFGSDKSPEVVELKEELKCHMIDIASEFIDEGHSREEAYDMAIEKFDMDNDILKMLCKNVKESNTKVEGRNKIIIKSINVTKIISLISVIVFIVSFILIQTNTIYKIQSEIWQHNSQEFTEKFSEFVSSKDIKYIEQYKSELDKYLQSEECKYIYRLYVYDNNNIFSQPKYSYQVKNGTSDFETNGETYKNKNGQVWYYRLKLKDFIGVKINNMIMSISLYTTIVFLIIHIIMKKQYKKL
ncbi:permease prefix domain 1-containing protein [Intestinibacter sp.]